MPKTISRYTKPASLISIPAAEAQTDVLLASIGDGVVTTDEYGNITRINPAALAMLGYKGSDLVGAWFPKALKAWTIDGQPIELIDRPITKAFLTGKPVTDKIVYHAKDGSTLPVSLTAAPIIVNDQPVGAIEVFRDIKLELEVDRMKSEFISLASHQLRTPLSAIKTYAHMMHDGFMGDLNQSQKQALDTVVTATNRMNALISTLLNITRIESGIISISPKSVRIDKLVDEVVRELSVMAGSKSITINVGQKGDSPLRLTTDVLIIKEVLTNLVSNAIKYTPEGGNISVVIRPKPTEIVVEVTDNGWGIPEHAKEQVFSKFFRGQNIVKRETSGTGLGLYLVKGLLEAIGGQIWFKSRERIGSSFFFAIPRKHNFKKGAKVG